MCVFLTLKQTLTHDDSLSLHPVASSAANLQMFNKKQRRAATSDQSSLKLVGLLAALVGKRVSRMKLGFNSVADVLG